MVIMKLITLTDLIGDFELDACDFATLKEPYNEFDDDLVEIINVIYFRLNGKIYLAKEDSNNGYRSLLGDIYEIENYNFKNTFPAAKVISVFKTVIKDAICFADKGTNKTVLEIGTDYSDDDYPSCIMYFDPTAMLINSLIPELNKQ